MAVQIYYIACILCAALFRENPLLNYDTPSNVSSGEQNQTVPQQGQASLDSSSQHIISPIYGGELQDDDETQRNSRTGGASLVNGKFAMNT